MTAEEAKDVLRNTAWLGTDNGEKVFDAIEIAIEALEKQTPMKPIETNRSTVYRCANCRAIVMQNLSTEKTDYCVRCGQKILWEEEE